MLGKSKTKMNLKAGKMPGGKNRRKEENEAYIKNMLDAIDSTAA